MRLIKAVTSGDLEAVRAAIAAGEAVNWIDVTGETGWPGWDAVEVAAHTGRADIVRVLLAAGARNRVFVDTAIAERHPGVVRAWLDAIASERQRHLNAGREDGETVLMLAARIGSADIVRLLLDAGADPTREDDEGLTALAIAEKQRQDALWRSEPEAERYARVAELLRSATPGPASDGRGKH